jgi:hypothetical protein
MFEKTLRNSLASYFNLRYSDTQKEDNQCYKFRAEKLKNPTRIHIKPKEIKKIENKQLFFYFFSLFSSYT